MGTEERDWVDVANDLLCKCHINLRLQRLTDCDANVFVALYEALLGEKVPDYIAVPKCQEDDIHNVQSVIDSLALDYLQISLSHITGENIVRGDKDTIRNLLEIFDGLLEYLTEQLSEEEELQNGEVNGTIHPTEIQEPGKEERMSHSSSVHSAVQSSKHSLHSWNGGESESTAELIRLGDSARTFTMKHEVRSHTLPPGVTSEKVGNHGPATAQATLLREPLRSAIALQPPSQTTPQRPERPAPPPSDHHTPPTDQDGTIRQNGISPRLQPDIQVNGTLHRPLSNSEGSVPSLREPQSQAPKGHVEAGAEASRRVLFRTQPDVLLLTLSDEQSRSQREDTHTLSPEEEDEGDEERPRSSGSSSGRRRSSRGWRGRAGMTDADEPLSRRSQKNRQTEQELQEMSEKLSRRLEELDLMLKRALGETGEEPKPQEEDKRSHHSDSIMECRRAPKPTDPESCNNPPRPRSLSPSPPPARRSLHSQLEGTLLTDSRPQTSRSRPGPFRDHEDQHRKSQMVAEAYKAELKNLDEQQRADLARERLRAQEAEREYREAIYKEASRVRKSSQTSRSKSALSNRTSRTRPPSSSRRQIQPCRVAPLRVKENDLLPALLEDYPPLPFSSHTISSMWKQQLRQVDQLNTVDNQRRNARSAKLTNQVEEAHKRHDLLMEIIHKEQEHNRRLKDFRERIQQQRSTQNKLREQRQQVARARKYHNDYHVQLRARLLRARTREERMFRQVFEEGLELQKARLREQRANAKEQRQEHQRKHREEIEAMENYYRDQFSMLAERLALERQEIQVRKKAQEKALHKMKRELRSKMEREISELQQIIVQNDEDDYFRDLEVERLRKRVQMASFQYRSGCTH
ncbi:centrosomal protein of 95 kDa-like isoform X2 [Salminus brasiliensis]|uniref:centrosomal protein of 95 kDa-like isoform X2 n=1 Tax=Salminus brasiliensis TaxID=930266 RepID=UPI003B82F5FC